MNDLPELYEDICESWKSELKEAFEPYFVEQCLDQYLRGLYDWDQVATCEILEENGKFIEDFFKDKLMDQC